MPPRPGAEPRVEPYLQARPSAPLRGSTAESAFQGPVYAGFWKRVGAYLLDSIIVTVLCVALAFGIALSSNMNKDAETFTLLIQGASFLVGWLYWALMESGRAQATFGKQALGIVVTDADGQRIGFWRATGRYFGKILSGLLLCIGFAMAGWTQRRQALHDMMASTLVVNREALREGALSSGAETPRAGAMSGAAIAGIAIAAGLGVIAVIGILAAISIPAYQDYTVRARVAETYTHGMAAARAVGSFYEAQSDVPATLEAAGYTAPAGFSIVVNPENGIVTARKDATNVSLTFVPKLQDGKVQWRCDAGTLPKRQVGSVCATPEQ